MSPHAAAKLEGLTISLDDFQAPITNKNLVIEGAGGLMSPIGDNFTNLDLMKKLGCSVILVSMNYLGSINHTLLSISVIKNNNIPLKGIIFNSDFNPESESFILKNTGIACLGRIPNIIPEPITVKKIAKEFQHILG